MNDISKVRLIRRKAFQDKSHLTIADCVDQNLIDDIRIASANASSFCFEILDGNKFDTTLIGMIPSIEYLSITKGTDIESINLQGLASMKRLLNFELDLGPKKPLACLDLSPLGGHERILSINLACLIKKLKLDGLGACPKLEAFSISSFVSGVLDLSQLSGASMLRSIFIGDLGREVEEKQKIRIVLPKNTHLRSLQISNPVNSFVTPDVDFSFCQSTKVMDDISLTGCNLRDFDLEPLTALERIGRIDLRQNSISRLNLTPLLEMPMLSMNNLGSQPFQIDNTVVLQIDSSRKKEIEGILEIPDYTNEDHFGDYPIEYVFGHQWLGSLLSKHSIEWI